MSIGEAQVAAFRENGFVSGIRVISEQTAADSMRKLAEYESDHGSTDALHMKSHIYFSWLWSIARSPAVLDAVRGIMGPDVLVLASRLWSKLPSDDKFVSWHQDVNYFGIEPSDASANIWIALSDASEEAGCMRFIPGSHKDGLLDHEITMASNNLLTRGQTVHGVDVTKAIPAPLKPGECSIHHGHVLHCSPPNRSTHRRVGFSMILLQPHVRSTTGRRTASLLCGEDRHGHWDIDPEPQCDRDPTIFARMQNATKTYVPADAYSS